MTAIVAIQKDTCFVCFLGIGIWHFYYNPTLKLTVYCKKDQMLAFVIRIGKVFYLILVAVHL